MNQVAPAPAIVQRPDGQLVAVAGASRSGKTVWVSREVAGDRRLLVWDFKNEWHVKYRCRRITSLAELQRLVKGPARSERLAFCGPVMDAQVFEVFCQLAWVWLRREVGALIIEEIASVTSPGKAPAGWGNIVRMGLGYGARIYSVTQRPSESDKTAIGNASFIHCHRMARDEDRKYMARELDVSLDQVKALKPLQWIERHADGSLRSGAVKLRARREPRHTSKASAPAIAGD
jgi:hypothetical protein